MSPTNGTTYNAMVTGPIVGLTASNSDYVNQIFSIFTDFGTPAAGGIPARPGFSGLQDSRRRSVDRRRIVAGDADWHGHDSTSSAAVHDPVPAIRERRFDQYGYFSQSVALTAATDRPPTAGQRPRLPCPCDADYGGSLFVSDLASGLYVTVTPLAPSADNARFCAGSRLRTRRRDD